MKFEVVLTLKEIQKDRVEERWLEKLRTFETQERAETLMEAILLAYQEPPIPSKNPIQDAA
jgi:phage terminase large subunit